MKLKWSRKYLFEWSRNPLSPVSQTWQIPILENSCSGLFKKKTHLDLRNPVKVFNGYLYLTDNNMKILLNPLVFLSLWKTLSGAKTAKKEWRTQVSIHLKELAKLRKKQKTTSTTKELFSLCDKVLKQDGSYIAWSLYSGIYSHGFEYLFSWLFLFFVKKNNKFRYTDLLKGFCNTSFEADNELWKLSKLSKKDEEFEKKLALWLNKYGHRIEDADLIHSTLGEQPKTVVTMIEQLTLQNADNPEKELKARELKRKKVEMQVMKNIRWWIPFGKIIFKKLLHYTQDYVSIREDRPFYYQGQALARKILLQIGSRLKKGNYLGDGNDVFFLTKKEILDFSNNKLKINKSEVKRRKKLYENQKLFYPLLNITEPFQGKFQKRKYNKRYICIKGVPVSRGKIVGKVRVVLSQSEFSNFKSGEILVTKATSPAWTSVITLAKGIITDIGGALCHAAIVSRELGIPAVVGTGNATTVLKDGDNVLIDSNEGTVKLIGKNTLAI